MPNNDTIKPCDKCGCRCGYPKTGNHCCPPDTFPHLPGCFFHHFSIEEAVLKLVVESVVAAGWRLNEIRSNTDHADVQRIASAAEAQGFLDTRGGDDVLICFDSPEGFGSWVRLISGNATDYISDYTTDLEGALAPINAWLVRAEEIASR